MEFLPDLKSAGLPVIFQRSVKSPNPLPPELKSSDPVASSTSHGWAALHGHDGVELPPFQQLGVAFFPGNGVTSRDRQAVPNVEVAAAVLPLWMRAVLWSLSLEIQGTVVEAMTVGVTSGEIQPVKIPLGQGRLQAVVVRMGGIRLFVNYLEIGEFGKERTPDRLCCFCTGWELRAYPQLYLEDTD